MNVDFFYTPLGAAVIAAVAALAAALANHRLAHWRDRRKEYNEIASAVREALTRYRNPVAPSPAVGGHDLDQLVATQGYLRRVPCRAAVAEYRSIYEQCIGRDSVGGCFINDEERLSRAIAHLLTFTRPR